MSWKPQGYPTGFSHGWGEARECHSVFYDELHLHFPLIGKCEIICRKKSLKNLCSVEMKDVFQFRLGTAVTSLGHSILHFPLSFSLTRWTSLFKILGFILCCTITPPPIICHFPNCWVFLISSSITMQHCFFVALLFGFSPTFFPFTCRVSAKCSVRYSCSQTCSLPPFLIAVPSELFQFSSACSESHISSVTIFISAPFIRVSFKLPSPFVLPQTNDQVGSIFALLFFLLSTLVWLILVFLIGPCNGDWAVTQTFTLSYHYMRLNFKPWEYSALSGKCESVI